MIQIISKVMPKKFFVDKIQNHSKYRKQKEKQKIYFPLVLILLIGPSFSFCDCTRRNFLHQSKIILKTKEATKIKILSDKFFKNFKPSSVIINGFTKTITNEYDYTSESTTIITWDISISSTKEMFEFCDKIIEIDLSNFDTSQVTDMNAMFFHCRELISLNLLNFDTSHVTDIGYMFSSCWKLTNLNLSIFNTSQVKDMDDMFSSCSELTSLDLSNFDTTKVTNMAGMFSMCNDLISLNILNFNTSQVKDMDDMFSSCSELTSLNLSNFDTSKVERMNGMFEGCSKLTSLNLSNFDTSKVRSLSRMFLGCWKLSFLNLSNFKTSEVREMGEMFSNCNSLTSLDLSNFNTFNVNLMHMMFEGCSNLISLDLSNFNQRRGDVNIYSMFHGCNNLQYINFKKINIESIGSSKYIFDYTSKNLMVCTERDNDIFLDLLGEKIILYCNYNNSFNEEYKCYMKNSTLYNKYTCNICNNNYLNKYHLLNFNNHSYINCFESKNYYYFDDINRIYQECYHSCLTCETSGNETNNNCLKCKNEFMHEVNIENSIYKNCYKKSSNESNLDEEQNLFTSELITNDKKYPFDSNEFVTNTNVNNIIENKTKIIKNIIDNILNNLDKINLNSGNDNIMIYENNMIVLTSTFNQKNNEEKNNITFDLGQCENILKNHYNISQNDSLYILQIIVEEEGMKIPKIEYEVYYPLYNINELKKLNLSLCKNTKIEISISVKIDDKIDKYNISSDYYNDFCTKATSESGADITLKTRRNEYIDKNMSLCEENCDLIEYNFNKEKAKCSCDIKLNIPENYDIKFNKNDFFKSFTDIKNIINLKVIKCYKIVYKIKNLKNNYGFYIIGFIIILFFITLFIFIIKSFHVLIMEINNIVLAIKKYKVSLGNNNIKKTVKIKKKKKKKIKNKNYTSINNNFITKENKTFQKSDLNSNNKTKIEKFNNQITQNSDYSSQRVNPISNIVNINENNNEYNINKILEKRDFEINLLNYEFALQLDHRTYFEYYFSILKNNHPITFSFFPFDDYNSKIIKMYLFFFSFGLDFTVNALFFTDDTMDKIYQDKGKFNFLYQIPQILYSALISRFIDSLIKKFALSQEDIVEFKQDKEKTELNKKTEKLIKKFKIKFILYFLLTFISLNFFWFYGTCFCGVYINTQTHLINDSIISAITSLLIPFGLYIIPSVFRISALRAEKQNRKLLYKFSMFLENWIG